MIQRSPRGFTIVELLIVIVIIAILAAITIAAFNGIQQRAQDTQIRSAAGQFVKSFQTWSLKSGKKTTLGGYDSTTTVQNGVCPDGDKGGWVAKGSYSGCTIDAVLVDSGDISSSLLGNLPGTNRLESKSYKTTTMLYPCGTGKYVFMYALNNADTAEMTKIRQECAGSPTADYAPITRHGMNGGIIFELPG